MFAATSPFSPEIWLRDVFDCKAVTHGQVIRRKGKVRLPPLCQLVQRLHIAKAPHSPWHNGQKHGKHRQNRNPLTHPCLHVAQSNACPLAKTSRFNKMAP